MPKLKHFIYSLSWILICLLLGKLFAHYVDILPASLYGMVFFAFALHFKLARANHIKDSIQWIVKNMSVCFVPAGVGLMSHVGLLKSHGLVMLLILLGTTIVLITLVACLSVKFIGDDT